LYTRWEEVKAAFAQALPFLFHGLFMAVPTLHLLLGGAALQRCGHRLFPAPALDSLLKRKQTKSKPSLQTVQSWREHVRKNGARLIP
jgi:hypothetical protein